MESLNSTTTDIPSQDVLTTFDSSGEFSWQSVFGMFLTLSLCLCSQPVGSLFYSPQKGWLGRFMSVTWRLNPLACFLEAVEILTALGLKAVQLWKDDHGPRFRLRDGDRGWIDGTVWRNRLHVTAVALLLVRASREGQDGRPIWEMLLELEDDDPALTSTSGATPPQIGILRRRTTHAEEGRMDSSAPLLNSPEARYAQLRQALGPNALTHRDLFVDFVALASETVVFVKLVTVGLPWKVLLSALCMVIGWFTLQGLLILLHARELEDVDLNATLAEARRIKNELWRSDKPILRNRAMTIILPLPLFAYFGLAIATTTFVSSMPIWLDVSNLIGCMFGLFFLAEDLVEFTGYDTQIVSTCWWILILLMMMVMPYTIGGAMGRFWIFLFQAVTWTGAVSGLYGILLAPRVSRDAAGFFWILSLVLTIQLFVFMLSHYDPSGTSKPDWLDLLG